jgi:hypothetical protein
LIDAVLIPKDSLGGNVFFENKTDKPITVKLPKAVVGVQILKQGFGGQQQGGGRQGGQQGGQQGGGQQQQQGGGFGGGQQGGGGGQQGGFGGGQFSVPPERVVQIAFKSVCLEHGKAEPHSTSRYRLARVETFSTDPVLKEALEIYATTDMDPKAAQAAIWSVADKMSWQELASKRYHHIGGRLGETYFTQNQILVGQQLIARAQTVAREKAKQPTSPATTVSQNSSAAN